MPPSTQRGQNGSINDRESNKENDGIKKFDLLIFLISAK